jgi:hypothetical protein
MGRENSSDCVRLYHQGARSPHGIALLQVVVVRRKPDRRTPKEPPRMGPSDRQVQTVWGRAFSVPLPTVWFSRLVRWWRSSSYADDVRRVQADRDEFTKDRDEM